MSPELRSLFIENEELNENNYDAFKSDVYSLGVTFVDLATSTIGESKPLKEKLDFIKKRYGSKFSDFLTEMLVEDFKQRKSIKELKQLFKENMILQVFFLLINFLMFYFKERRNDKIR